MIPVHVARLAAMVLTCLTLAVRPAVAGTYDYVAGHGDIGLSYTNATDALRIYLNFDASSVVRDMGGTQLSPAELNALQSPAGTGEWSMAEFRVVVPEAQQVVRAATSNWNFIGVAAGEPYWELPQSAKAGVPFFGFERRPTTLANATFTLGNVLLAPAGGVISAWQYDVFGEPDLGTNRYWSTASGFEAANAITLSQGHQHFNFGFSQQGLYQFEIVGTTSATSQTAMGVLTVNVVPEPSSAALGAGGIAVLFWRLWRRNGSEKSPVGRRRPNHSRFSCK